LKIGSDQIFIRLSVIRYQIAGHLPPAAIKPITKLPRRHFAIRSRDLTPVKEDNREALAFYPTKLPKLRVPGGLRVPVKNIRVSWQGGSVARRKGGKWDANPQVASAAPVVL
jgi:hypothetical protein